jgi:CheY-like chemotaxis protein
VRQSLALALQSEHFQVITASNGKEALEKYFEGYVDLVLLDLNMPVQNGWDTFERLTALNPYLAIILITARLNQRELAAIAGATAIMEKPLNVPLLVEAMNRLVEEPLENRLRRIAAQRPLILSTDV